MERGAQPSPPSSTTKPPTSTTAVPWNVIASPSWRGSRGGGGDHQGESVRDTWARSQEPRERDASVGETCGVQVGNDRDSDYVRGGNNRGRSDVQRGNDRDSDYVRGGNNRGRSDVQRGNDRDSDYVRRCNNRGRSDVQRGNDWDSDYVRGSNSRGRGNGQRGNDWGRGGAGGSNYHGRGSGRGRGRDGDGSWQPSRMPPPLWRTQPAEDNCNSFGTERGRDLSCLRPRGGASGPGQYRGRDGLRQQRGRGKTVHLAMEVRRPVIRNQHWAFWTLLCGAANSPVVFTDYKGVCTNPKHENGLRRGFIKAPLFQPPASNAEICERFKAKLQSLAKDVAECTQLDNPLLLHIRIGDLFVFHQHFRFDCRPGPRLEDFSQLLDDRTFPEARERLAHFFDDGDIERRSVTSTFVTEKPCGSHTAMEAFLDLQGFEFSEMDRDDFTISVSLNGERSKFEVFYSMRDLKLKNMLLITRKWNFNLITAKGTNYQGTFREKADLRLQFEPFYNKSSMEKVEQDLRDEGFDVDGLQQLFDRIGDDPSAVSGSSGRPSVTALSDAPERSYRVRLPELVPKLEYMREQHNRTFVRKHDRWPFAVQLRQFKFFKLATDGSPDLFTGQVGVEFRVTAKLDCQLDKEVLEEQEFVNYLWECSQLMQELVATSLEV